MFFETLAVMSVVSGFMGASAAQKRADAQSYEARVNAQYLKQQAEFSRYMAYLDMKAADEEHERHVSSQESMFAAAGVSMSGSVLEALGESQKAQEKNHFRRLLAAENDANYMLTRADMNERMANMYQEAADIEATSSILGGFIGAASFGAKAGMHKASYWGGGGSGVSSKVPGGPGLTRSGPTTPASLSSRGIGMSEASAYGGFASSMFPFPMGHSNKPIRRTSLGGSRY